jgi:hypothetical protein
VRQLNANFDTAEWGFAIGSSFWGTADALVDVPAFPEEDTAEIPPSLDLEFGDSVPFVGNVLPIGGF